MNMTETPLRRRRSRNQKLESTIVDLADLGYSSAEIEAHLKKTIPDGKIPSVRTIQRIVARLVPQPAEPWSLAHSSGEDASLVLEVLKEVALMTEGRRTSFSQAQAELIVKIRRAAPGLLAAHAWIYAREFSLRLENGTECSDLDLALAFAPPGPDETNGAFVERVKAHAKLHYRAWPKQTLKILASRAMNESLIHTFGAWVTLSLPGLEREVSFPGMSLGSSFFALHEVQRIAEREGIEASVVAERRLDEELARLAGDPLGSTQQHSMGGDLDEQKS